MKSKTPWILASVLGLLIISCTKEKSVDSLDGGSPSGTEKGNWQFAGLHAETSQTVEMEDGVDMMSTVTVSNYNTFI